MSQIVRHQLPRIVERGYAQALTLDVYSAASAQLTATAATVTIRLGTKIIVDGASATTLGPPASYTLSAATTADESLSDAYLESWVLTIGGSPVPFTRSGYLVRTAFHPTITDTDLTDRDGDLLNLTAESTLQKYREAARQRIERDLLRLGRRPWLIFDSYMLVDAHIALSLHLFYQEQKMGAGPDSRFADAATEMLKEYDSQFSRVNFRYDADETGTITDETNTGGSPTLILSGGPASGRPWFRGRGRYG